MIYGRKRGHENPSNAIIILSFHAEVPRDFGLSSPITLQKFAVDSFPTLFVLKADFWRFFFLSLEQFENRSVDGYLRCAKKIAKLK